MSDATGEGIAVGRWLRHLEQQVPIARAGVDPEGAHQVRVAIARIRVWLALGGWRVLDDDLRWLRDRLAAIRDVDVELQQEPPPRWAATLHRRHARAQRALLATLQDERLPSALLALSCLPSIPPTRARRMLPRMARAVLACGHVARRSNRDLASLHRLRREVRRLRFALEWLGEDATELVKVQESIGTACDFGVVLRDLGARHGRGVRRYRAKLALGLSRAQRQSRIALRRACPYLKELASCSSS